MEGTATISLDTLDELRAKAEEAETEKKRSDWYEGAETDSGGTERVVIPAENVDIVDKSSDTETKEDK